MNSHTCCLLAFSTSNFWKCSSPSLLWFMMRNMQKFVGNFLRMQISKNIREWLLVLFLQRVSIASSYAKRCISYDRFCLTVRPSVTVRYHAKTTIATIMRSSPKDSPMILVSWRLTSPRHSKGNIGSEGAEWERGSKNVAKIGNF